MSAWSGGEWAAMSASRFSSLADAAIISSASAALPFLLVGERAEANWFVVLSDAEVINICLIGSGLPAFHRQRSPTRMAIRPILIRFGSGFYLFII
jgi:hypothetical protein